MKYEAICSFLILTKYLTIRSSLPNNCILRFSVETVNVCHSINVVSKTSLLCYFLNSCGMLKREYAEKDE